MSLSLLFVLVSWISLMPYPTRAQDGYRELYFRPSYFFAEKRLLNHKINSTIVKDLDECEYHCYLDPNCVSLNIKKNVSSRGTHECELNNSTHVEHDGHLEDNHLYYYHGAENHCGKNQEKCQNNATCLSGFTSKRYRCVCSPGFEGEYCEHDDVCHNYKNLTDAERKYDHETKNPKSDTNLNGWYRFQGAAGTEMATTCPPMNRCGGSYTIWMSGRPPTVAEGTVERKVCINKFNCCKVSFYIEEKNCGSYYIYKLTGSDFKMLGGDIRYCGND